MTPRRNTKTTPKKKVYATPALEKGLDVLELLAHQLGGLTRSEISSRLHRSVSEIFRMLVCLEERGYITQTDGDRYALTLKLFRLVHEHPPTERLITEATPVMQRLSQEIRQSCHMGVIEGAQVIILAQVNGPSSINLSVKLGSTVELMEATTGLVILAHQEPALRESVLAEWKRITGRHLPADLSSHVARIRRKGFDKHASYKVRGVVDLCYPIFDGRGSAIGALTVPYLQHTEASITAQKTCALLEAAAHEITAAIGGQRRRSVTDDTLRQS